MKLSVITVNLNDRSGLEQTIKSVIDQSFTDYEYIVVDGGSTDGSVEIIRNYENKIARWISEKDNGTYEAMNKGIKLANGDYLLMLNSGDYLADNTVLEKAFHAVQNEDIDIIYGDIFMNRRGIHTPDTFPEELTFGFFMERSLSHQATFIKRTLHDLVGLYSEHMKIAADWKFFILAICKFNATYRHIPVTITVYNAEGISSDPKNYDRLVDEQDKVKRKHFPAFWPDYQISYEQKMRLKYFMDTKFYKAYKILVAIKKKIKPQKN